MSYCGSPPPARRGPGRTTWRRRGCTVHLRLRGEDLIRAQCCPPPVGSPPPARRGLTAPRYADPSTRFTSACAERTARLLGARGVQTVHLRLRGEDGPPTRTGLRLVGSPPPARRGRRDAEQRGRAGRFTSACAERTSGGCGARSWTTVHLRLRGEDPSRPAVLGALCQFVIQGTPVMHPPESTGPHGLSQAQTSSQPLTSARAETALTSAGGRST